jgi:drug/metabolite transporter superfamily protein YnfA
LSGHHRISRPFSRLSTSVFVGPVRESLRFTFAFPLNMMGRMQIVAWVAFVLAAVFEVGGDAVIRIGIKNNNLVVMIFGALILAGYGLIVNSLDWDFSKILGVYVAVFALAGVLFGRFVFRENIPFTTWLGLGFIILGGVIVQGGIAR